MSGPRDPEGALLLATLYQQLGGSFIIHADGRRSYGCEVNTGDRLRVALMIESLLDHLSTADLDVVYAAFGECDPDPSTITATFSEPMRRAA